MTFWVFEHVAMLYGVIWFYTNTEYLPVTLILDLVYYQDTFLVAHLMSDHWLLWATRSFEERNLIQGFILKPSGVADYINWFPT